MKLEWRLLATERWVGIAVILFAFIAMFTRVAANVTLQDFGAKAEANRIKILWSTASEFNNAGFDVLRSTAANGTYTKINPARITPQGYNTGAIYSFYDTAVTPGVTYYYRLVSIDTSSKTETTTPVSAVIAGGATATRTTTSAPTATTTRTSTTAPTATRTNTLVPGAPTFTPAPTSTPSPVPTAAQKIAQAAPSPTTARAGGAIIVPTATPAPGANPTRIALAPVEPTDPPSEDAPLEEEEIVMAQPARFNFAPFVAIGIILATGATSVAGFALAMFALYFFIRSKRSV